MHIVFEDKKNGLIKVKADIIEDLWHLSHIIREGDIVEGKSMRVVEFGDKQEKKPIHVVLNVEKVEFAEHSNKLRLTGKIIEGRPEKFIQKGRYHTLEISVGDDVAIKKPSGWMKFERERLKEAIKESKRPRAIIALVDDERLIIAKLLPYGVEIQKEFNIRISKKNSEESYKRREKVFDEAVSMIDRDTLLIVCGPNMSKDVFLSFVKSKGRGNVISIETSSADVDGIRELAESGKLKEILGEQRLAKEAELICEFKKHVFKDDGMAVYGKNGVKRAAEMSAVDTLLVTDELLRKDDEIREIVGIAEKSNARVFIFSSKSEWGMQLSGFGGIAGILRFPIN